MFSIDVYLSLFARWTHLVVDHVATKQDLLDVFFLATEDGKIQKMMRLPTSPPSPSGPPFVTCMVEDIKIVPNGKPRPVKAMKLSPTKVGSLADYASSTPRLNPAFGSARFKKSNVISKHPSRSRSCRPPR